MKRILTLLAFVLFLATYTNAQIIISEIMYNPPEGGTDSLEYVEIYNAGDIGVNLNGYTFTQGLTFTFSDTTIAPGGFIVIAENPSALMNQLGVAALIWDGALSNGGETLTIEDSNGNLVTSVDYSPDSPWPTFADGTDGGGASIEFCIGSGDNGDAANWRVSTAATGVIINDREIIATPGAENSVTCEIAPAETVILSGLNFTPADITINIGDKVLWKNESGSHNVNGSLATYPNNPEGFLSGSASAAPWEFEFTFNTPGLYNYQCDPHVGAGMVGTVTVVEESVEITSIADASAIDADGVAVNSGNTLVIEGRVYGINMRPGGLQFTLIDGDNEGIGVFSSSENFDYTVTEGDQLRIYGTVSQFNGLTQIAPDSLEIIEAGIPIITPRITTILGEEEESSLVTIEDVKIIDPSEWSGSGSGFNVSVTNGTDTFTVRIDADVVDLYEGDAPQGTFNVTGIGGQFDSSSPYFDGYQLFPRYAADINPYVTGGTDDFPARSIGDVTTIDENGVADSLGLMCTITGVTYGVNLRPDGLQFTLIDSENNGIGLFLSSGNMGYTYAEGDEITVKGIIDQFNGLTQIMPEEITLNSSGNTLVEPTPVNTLNEETESQLVLMENITVLDPTQWEANGGSFNVDILTPDGETLTMRIDGDVELSSMELPGTNLSIIGIGGQFDNSSPFDEGYQIFPRYASDVMVVSNTKDLLLKNESVTLYPNPTKEVMFLNTNLNINKLIVFDAVGKLVLESSQKSSRLNVSQLNNGNYFLQIIAEEGVVVKQFIKE